MPLREEAPSADAPAAGPPCAFQACDRPAAAYPVVELPPPAATASGQPLRVVFRRSPVCDLHRRQMVLHLGAHLAEGLAAYLTRRALPAPEWDAATWQWEPVAP
jgi:hypothetical protein